MNKTYSLTLIALGAALVAALSPFQIPLGPIPITLQTLAIGLVATIYRPKEATLAIVLYLLLLDFLFLQVEKVDFKLSLDRLLVF